MHEAKCALAQSDAMPIHPMRLCAEVNARLDADATVVADASNMLMWTDASLRARKPGRLPGMGNLGTIGHGVCYTLAAGIARPGTQCVWMVGDGSFGFNAMELDTAARHGVPIVTVIMNNQGWSAGWVPLGVRHYERMAAAFDGEGFFVERPEQIGPALDAAFASNGTVDRQRDGRPGRRILPRPRAQLTWADRRYAVACAAAFTRVSSSSPSAVIMFQMSGTMSRSASRPKSRLPLYDISVMLSPTPSAMADSG